MSQGASSLWELVTAVKVWCEEKAFSVIFKSTAAIIDSRELWSLKVIPCRNSCLHYYVSLFPLLLSVLELNSLTSQNLEKDQSVTVSCLIHTPEMLRYIILRSGRASSACFLILVNIAVCLGWNIWMFGKCLSKWYSLPLRWLNPLHMLIK